jgi:Aspartyl/Asparaginyl beta-hydroxylase
MIVFPVVCTNFLSVIRPYKRLHPFTSSPHGCIVEFIGSMVNHTRATKPPMATEAEYSTYENGGTNSTSAKSPSAAPHTSSAEEIQAQHAAAAQRVAEGLVFSEPTRHEEIPLSEKQQPVKNSGVVFSGHACWSSRGYADVTVWKDLVRNGYNRNYDLRNVATKEATDQTLKNKSNDRSLCLNPESESSSADEDETMNYWDPAMAAAHNVYIQRPSHDAWGIPKIVLIYSDDFLQETYDFPWLQDDFLPALQPILDVLQLPLRRIVRLLLASLPPDTTIPVHFDTGEWVKHTHRIHVPILVQDVSKIVFCCGPSLDEMATIECRPGHVFEINNQAHHCVSNCDADYRVHLILDYVDEGYKLPPRYALARGETVVQTRRSIDRLCNYGRRPTPTFIILGTQKAGTTYLFELIMQHPLCIRPKNNRRETHCLDWNWKSVNGQISGPDNGSHQQKWCHSFFYHEELQRHPSCCTGDSTPSYLMDHVRVIPRIRQVYPHVQSELKFFVLCREPLQRAQSHYAMVTSNKGTPAQLKARGSEWRRKSLAQVVLQDLHRLWTCGLLPYWKMDFIEEAVAETLETNDAATNGRPIPWEQAVFDPQVFASFSGSEQEFNAWSHYVQKYVPLHTGSYGLLSRGLYGLQIRAWLREFPASQFRIFKLEAMTSSEDVAYATLNEVWKHIEVPYYELPIEAVRQPQNAREYSVDLSPQLLDFLYRFYEPHNRRLHEMMRTLPYNPENASEDTLWEHHWGPSSASLWKSEPWFSS